MTDVGLIITDCPLTVHEKLGSGVKSRQSNVLECNLKVLWFESRSLEETTTSTQALALSEEQYLDHSTDCERVAQRWFAEVILAGALLVLA